MGAWLNAIGAALRIVSGKAFNIKTSLQSIKFILLMLGQSLGACAQPFLLNAPTKLAANWFGESERATANMLSSLGFVSFSICVSLEESLLSTVSSYFTIRVLSHSFLVQNNPG